MAYKKSSSTKSDKPGSDPIGSLVTKDMVMKAIVVIKETITYVHYRFDVLTLKDFIRYSNRICKHWYACQH